MWKQIYQSSMGDTYVYNKSISDDQILIKSGENRKRRYLKTVS